MCLTRSLNAYTHHLRCTQLQGADICVDDVQPSWLSPEPESESESGRTDSNSTSLRTYSPYGQRKKGNSPSTPGLVLVERVPVGNAAIAAGGSSSDLPSACCRWTLVPDPGMLSVPFVLTLHCFLHGPLDTASLVRDSSAQMFYSHLDSHTLYLN